MKGYRMKCCECGAVHEFEFSVVEQVGKPDRKGFWRHGRKRQDCRVLFRARREE